MKGRVEFWELRLDKLSNFFIETSIAIEDVESNIQQS